MITYKIIYIRLRIHLIKLIFILTKYYSFNMVFLRKLCCFSWFISRFVFYSLSLSFLMYIYIYIYIFDVYIYIYIYIFDIYIYLIYIYIYIYIILKIIRIPYIKIKNIFFCKLTQLI